MSRLRRTARGGVTVALSLGLEMVSPDQTSPRERMLGAWVVAGGKIAWPF